VILLGQTHQDKRNDRTGQGWWPWHTGLEYRTQRNVADDVADHCSHSWKEQQNNNASSMNNRWLV